MNYTNQNLPDTCDISTSFTSNTLEETIPLIFLIICTQNQLVQKLQNFFILCMAWLHFGTNPQIHEHKAQHAFISTNLFLLLLLLTLWWINIGTLKGKWKCCVEVKSVVIISYYLQPLLLFSWTQNHVFVTFCHNKLTPHCTLV